MCDTSAVALLYSNVITQDIRKFNLSEHAIQIAIKNMAKAYEAVPSNLSLLNQNPVANYNDSAHRCGYLHRFAPFHTKMTADLFLSGKTQYKFYLQNVLECKGVLNICSLGGGPGSDVLGILSILHELLGFFRVRVTIVDCMEQWKNTFSTLVKELVSNQEGAYGKMSQWASPQYLQWSYLQCNLLYQLCPEVVKALQSADLVTMVKFVSAAASRHSSRMLMDIFRCLKPDAFVLYIDNAGGRFHQLLNNVANQCEMKSSFGPKHLTYHNESYNVARFGYAPCVRSKVCVEIWQKKAANNANSARPITQQPTFVPNREITENPEIIGNPKIITNPEIISNPEIKRNPERIKNPENIRTQKRIRNRKRRRNTANISNTTIVRNSGKRKNEGNDCGDSRFWLCCLFCGLLCCLSILALLNISHYSDHSFTVS